MIRKTVLRVVVLAAVAALLGSCVVNKANLARRVDLQDVDLSKVPDGVYQGAYTIHPPFPETAANKSVEVRVTVAGGKYTKIELIKPPALAGASSFEGLFTRVKNTQHLSVDAITSATISSVAILKAIQVAVSSPAVSSQ
jgi:uncharacterized protein with FMN-binding domain